jgi:hypothetical protein
MEYDIIKIRSLCDRYFDGDTTADEEMMLRDYFTHEKDIPADLKAVKVIMCGFSDAAVMAYYPKTAGWKPLIRKILWGTVAAAASVAILLAFRNEEVYGYDADGNAITDPVIAMEGVRYLTYLETFETTIDIAEMLAAGMGNND